MAHSLKMKVTAEGVETREQFAVLRELDCDAVQGYYFSPAVPAEEFEGLICAKKSMADKLSNS